MAANFLRTLWQGKSGARRYWYQCLSRQAPADRAHLTPGLEVYGHFHAESGLGSAARGFVRALETTDVPHTFATLSTSGFEDRVPFPAQAAADMPYRAAMFYLNPDVLLQSGRPTESMRFAGRHRIAHWAWELPVFPPQWAAALDLVDEIWVATSFVAGSVAAATQKPVRIVPYAVQPPAFDRDEARRRFGLPADALIFLTAFDFNSFPARKNPLATIRAFRDAFPRGRGGDEILIVKSHGRTNRDKAEALFAAAGADPRIRWIDEVFSETDIHQLQSASDAFVSLHRSEGFGLNIAECMGLGKPAVATQFAGAADFIDAEHSFPVGYSMRRVLKDEYLHGDGQWWAEPDHDGAVDALRVIRNDPAEAARRGARAKTMIAERFSFQAVGRAAKTALAAGGV